MKKRVRKILLIGLFIVLALPLLGYGLVLFFAKDLKEYAVVQINNQINAKLEIGNIDMSLFKQFPKVGLHLHDVRIANNAQLFEGNLLNIKDVNINFNLWNVITKNYQISNIILSDGVIDGLVDAKGNNNYDILKKSKDSNQESKFWLNLNYIELRNIFFKHTHNQFVTQFHINNMKAAGAINNNTIIFEQHSDLNQLQIVNNKNSICKNRNLVSYLNCSIGLSKELITIHKSTLISEELKTEVEGTLFYGIESNIALAIKGQEMKISSLASVLGISIDSSEYKSEGDIYINCNILGRTDKRNTPELKLNFGIHHGQLVKANQKLRDILLEGEYIIEKNKSIESGILTIPTLSAKINQSNISGNLYLKGLKNPSIRAKLKANIEASDLQFLLQGNNTLGGKINANVAIECQPKQNVKDYINDIKAEGQIEFENLSYLLPEQNIEKLNGALHFNKNSIELEKLTGYYNTGYFGVHGKLENWYGYLFNHSVLNLTASMSCTQFVYKSKITNDTQNSAFAFPPRIEAKIKFDCKQFKFNNLVFTDASAGALMDEESIKVTDLKASAFGGNIKFESLDLKRFPNGFILSTRGNIYNVSISDFFRDFNNFNQSVLTYKQIEGKATIKEFQALIYFDDRLNIITKKVKTEGHLLLENGQLNNFEPALKMAKFVDVNELRNLKFNKLENDILIYDGIIHMPQMNIQSNAINLAIKGEHDFNNNLDYYIKIKLNEVLFKKRAKNKNDEFGELIDEGRRGIYLYLHMTGVPPDVKITYDKKGFKKEATKTIKEEKEKVKDLFKQEFKGVNDDKLNPKNEKRFEQPQNDSIEWDG